jgi:mRNA interferase RelE/StbE
MTMSGVSSISIRWDRRSVRELKALPRADQKRVLGAVEALREAPLRGLALSGDWQGLRRIRVGSYRVVYGFDGKELLVSVVRSGHRRDVYR